MGSRWTGRSRWSSCSGRSGGWEKASIIESGQIFLEFIIWPITPSIINIRITESWAPYEIVAPSNSFSLAAAKTSIILKVDTCLKSNFIHFSYNDPCENVDYLAIVKDFFLPSNSLATAKLATFLQALLWKKITKFDSKQLLH